LLLLQLLLCLAYLLLQVLHNLLLCLQLLLHLGAILLF
jgi:hypothetical protein